MSEFLPDSSLSPAEYQRFVASTQIDMGDDWRLRYADWIRSESVEFLGQHGPGALLVMPSSFAIDEAPIHENFPELKEQMLDELGDLLWFGFGVAENIGIDAIQTCQQSLTERGVSINEPLDTFEKLTLAVQQHANSISVANKISVIMPDVDDAIKMTTLNENPFYVLQRTVGRLCRALDQDINDSMPPTMSELEAPVEINQTIGNYINTLSYITSIHLGADLQSVVSKNIQKLQDRQLYGKQ